MEVNILFKQNSRVKLIIELKWDIIASTSILGIVIHKFCYWQ